MSNKRKRMQRDDAVAPVGGAAQQGDPLAGNFIDNDEFGIVAAAFTCGNGGCWNP